MSFIACEGTYEIVSFCSILFWGILEEPQIFHGGAKTCHSKSSVNQKEPQFYAKTHTTAAPTSDSLAKAGQNRPARRNL